MFLVLIGATVVERVVGWRDRNVWDVRYVEEEGHGLRFTYIIVILLNFVK